MSGGRGPRGGRAVPEGVDVDYPPARDLGVGTVLTTMHRYHDAEVKALLGIPPEIVVAAFIPMGYPLGKFGAGPRKPLEEVLCFDRWEQR